MTTFQFKCHRGSCMVLIWVSLTVYPLPITHLSIIIICRWRSIHKSKGPSVNTNDCLIFISCISRRANIKRNKYYLEDILTKHMTHFAAGLSNNRIICDTIYRVAVNCSAQEIQRFELPLPSIVLCLQINQECGVSQYGWQWSATSCSRHSVCCKRVWVVAQC